MKNIFLALLFLIVLTLGYLYSQEKGVSARRANMMALQQDSLNIERKAFVVNGDLIKQLKKENESLKEDLKEFKKVDSYTTVKTVTRVDTVVYLFLILFPILVFSMLILTPLFLSSLLRLITRRLD